MGILVKKATLPDGQLVRNVYMSFTPETIHCFSQRNGIYEYRALYHVSTKKGEPWFATFELVGKTDDPSTAPPFTFMYQTLKNLYPKSTDDFSVPLPMISLGSACGTADFLQNKNIKNQLYYPFDWGYTNPEFVLQIINLCTSNISSDSIIANYFFKNRYTPVNGGDFASCMVPGEGCFANTDYRVAFPNENGKETSDVMAAYARRLDRFRTQIMNNGSEVTYLWASPGQTPLFDGQPIVQNLDPLNTIASIIKKYNPSARVIVFTVETDLSFSSDIEHYILKDVVQELSLGGCGMTSVITEALNRQFPAISKQQ